jgi:hypothetical protein
MRINIPLVGLVFVIFLFASCESTFTPFSNEVIPLSFENFEEARFINVTDAGTDVYRDNESWAALWYEYWKGVGEPGEEPPILPVDFNKEMVIAVFYGTGYSGCTNWIEVIEEIVKRSGQIEVRIRSFSEQELGPCDAPAYPLHMVKLEKSCFPVIFVGEVPE